MVDTAQDEIPIGMGDDVQGVPEVMKILDITKMTLYKWILQKKIGVRRFRIGKRVVLGFNDDEVDRVKSLLVKKRRPGKSLIQG